MCGAYANNKRVNKERIVKRRVADCAGFAHAIFVETVLFIQIVEVWFYLKVLK